MKFALINGLIGTFLFLIISLFYLNFQLGDSLQCLLSSYCATLAAFLITLKIQQTHCFLKKVKTCPFLIFWCLLISIYMGLLFTAAPSLRNSNFFVYLVIPLLFSNGIGVVFFGIIQDFLVQRKQKKNKW